MVAKKQQIKKRCPWAEISDEMRAYHDTEWGVPLGLSPLGVSLSKLSNGKRDERVLFEYILLDSFQAGLSWAIILNKRENFRKAFGDFDPDKIARYDKKKVARLLADAGIVRNRGKIEATISNAKIFLEIQKEFGNFANYLLGFMGGSPRQNKWRRVENIPARTEEGDKISADLKKRGFRFFGPITCYAFMQGAGLVNDHLASCFRHKECAT